jgi:hypothetical protein
MQLPLKHRLLPRECRFQIIMRHGEQELALKCFNRVPDWHPRWFIDRSKCRDLEFVASDQNDQSQWFYFSDVKCRTVCCHAEPGFVMDVAWECFDNRLYLHSPHGKSNQQFWSDGEHFAVFSNGAVLTINPPDNRPRMRKFGDGQCQSFRFVPVTQ